MEDGAAVHLSPQASQTRLMRVEGRPVEAGLVVPFTVDGRSIGLSMVARREPPPFDATSLRVLNRLVDETVLALDNAISVRQTRELVVKDDLTRAYNRRYFETYLKDELLRAGATDVRRPSSSWTWTGSRRSTTSTATSSGARCSRRWPTASS